MTGTLAIRQPAIFLDFSPAPAGAAVPDDAGLPDRDQVEQALFEQALQPFLEEISTQRTREIETIARHLEISLNELIHRQNLRMAELLEAKEAGDTSPLLAANLKTITVEFKGEGRGGISDREIYEAVVCLANADGGTILLGVEDDGRITGVKPRHGATTDPGKVQAAIFNNTEPRINTRVWVIPTPDGSVIAIQLDRYPYWGTLVLKQLTRGEGPAVSPVSRKNPLRGAGGRRICLGWRPGDQVRYKVTPRSDSRRRILT